MKLIVMTFDDNGKASVDAQGFQGVGCKAATKSYEDALGAVAGRTDKPELRTAPAPARQARQEA